MSIGIRWRRPASPFLYLRQGRVPAFVRTDDPPTLADELAALRRRLDDSAALRSIRRV